jgi:hypothetical protein
MTSIKIIKKFYTQKDALKAASYFKNQYKKDGQKVYIEIIEAYKVHSSIKKSIGSPNPNDYIIIIKRQQPNTIKQVAQKVVKKVKMIVSKVIKPFSKLQQKPVIQIPAASFTKNYNLSPAASLNILPIIVPFSLYNRHTA